MKSICINNKTKDILMLFNASNEWLLQPDALDMIAGSVSSLAAWKIIGVKPRPSQTHVSTKLIIATALSGTRMGQGLVCSISASCEYMPAV